MITAAIAMFRISEEIGALFVATYTIARPIPTI